MKTIKMFVSQGFRKGKKGEYLENDNSICKIIVEETASAFMIYRLEEVPIPEGAENMHLYFKKDGNNVATYGMVIQLFKPKVKKWKWLICIGENYEITNYMTEDEIIKYGAKYLDFKFYRKIPESLREV